METLPTQNRARNIHGITAKQERFCQEVALLGKTLVDAYRAAFDVKGISQHHKVEAKRLASVPAIDRRMKALLNEQKELMLHDGVRIREHVIKGLLRESDPDENPSPSARVAALVNLGKIDVVGMFKEHVVKEDQRKAGDIEAELRDKLRKLLSPEMKGRVTRGLE